MCCKTSQHLSVACIAESWDIDFVGCTSFSHLLLQASFGEAQKFLTSQGVNPPALVEKAGKAGTAAEGAFNQAKPSLTSSLTSLSARDPGTLVEYALGAVAIYYLVISHFA